MTTRNEEQQKQQLQQRQQQNQLQQQQQQQQQQQINLQQKQKDIDDEDERQINLFINNNGGNGTWIGFFGYIVLFIVICCAIIIESLYLLNTSFNYNETLSYCTSISNSNTTGTINASLMNNDYTTHTIPIHYYNNFPAKLSNKSIKSKTINLHSCSIFSQNYYEARTKFRTAINQLQITTNNNNNNKITLEHIIINDPNISTIDKLNTMEYTDIMKSIPGWEEYNSNKKNSTANANANANADYTIDIATIKGNQPGLVIHTSGVHGIEGYTGSAIQIAYIHLLIETVKMYSNSNHTTNDENTDTDNYTNNNIFNTIPTIIFIHTFNPYGMSHYRRTNENNVDLNRNGLSYKQWLSYASSSNHFNRKFYDKCDGIKYKKRNSSISNNINSNINDITKDNNTNNDLDSTYIKIGTNNSYFNPTYTNPTWYDYNIYHWYKTMLVVLQLGTIQLKRSMVGGQYHKQSGIFYGGGSNSNSNHNDNNNDNNNKVEASIYLIQQWFENIFFIKHPTLLQDHIATTFIDVHTGLGKLGEDTILLPAHISYLVVDDNNNDSATTTTTTSSSSSTIPKKRRTLENDSFQLDTYYPNSINGSPVKDKMIKTPVTTLPPTPEELYSIIYYIKTFFLEIKYFFVNTFKASMISGSVQEGYDNIQGTVVEYYKNSIFQHQYNILTLTQEFGTVPTPIVGRALIFENSIYHSNTISLQEKIHWAYITLYTVFYPQSIYYRKEIIHRGLYVLQQSIYRTIQLTKIASTETTTTTTETELNTEQPSEKEDAQATITASVNTDDNHNEKKQQQQYDGEEL